MKCRICNDAETLPYKDVCGICEIAAAGKFPGVQTASLVPAGFNLGLGEYIEDYDHLKRRRRALKAQGVIDDWE